MRRLDGITDSMELEQTLGNGEGQGEMACCSPLGGRVRRECITEEYSIVHCTTSYLSIHLSMDI